MPHLGPISRRELIRALRKTGFDGPYTGGKHSFMAKEDITITLPNPHRGDIGKELLARILRQGGISKEQWEKLN
jgi:predicted RNA binding protein YcfA (HicA-like mRNA interferase family)